MPLFNLSESLEDFPSQTFVVFDFVNPQFLVFLHNLQMKSVFCIRDKHRRIYGKSQIEHAFTTCSIQRVLKDN